MNWDLIADIGGTNTRLARFQSGEIDARTTTNTGGAGSILRALEVFTQQIGTAPARTMIAVAGAVLEGAVKVTNGEDRIEISAIMQATTCKNVRLINDFEAAAWSLAHVKPEDITPLQGPKVVPDGHRIILGAGTGLGVGALIRTDGGFQALPGEGGHVGIAPLDAFERSVFELVARIWPETAIHPDGSVLEAEAILSGVGLPILYRAICRARSHAVQSLDAGEICQAAQEGHEDATKAVQIFSSHLAHVAGNLAVSLSPKGGVFLAGGVLQQNPWLLDQRFLDSFNAGGRFTSFRESFPIYIYDSPDFGLIGAANALTYG